ncbi:MAG TPA: ribbon-helix-helix domain-containing protein [Stellaceae bacterium]|nr:ribbon-helix-helix domain-containing protein [Stellaceae bacterium]
MQPPIVGIIVIREKIADLCKCFTFSIMGREAFPAADRAEPPRATSTLINRNITVAGRRTSIRLEPQMWDALHQICRREAATLNEIVTEIERRRAASSLTAAIRVFVLSYFRAAATDEGHRLAGHGTGQSRT